MGLFDGVVGGLGRFLESRGNDFVKLDTATQDIFGPGPLLVLYRVPPGIDTEEVQDMIDAPRAFTQKVTIARVEPQKEKDSSGTTLFDLSLEQALEQLVASPTDKIDPVESSSLDQPFVFGSENGATITPVLFFSGFENREMMNLYMLLSGEIYRESGLSAACAKAVPNAMSKSFQQVLDEICGDHEDAMKMQQQDDENDS